MFSRQGAALANSDCEEKRAFYEQLHSQINSHLFLRKGAGMAVGAGEILIDGIDVEEGVAFGAEFFEIVARALREDGVTGIAVVRRDHCPDSGGVVIAVLTTEGTA